MFVCLFAFFSVLMVEYDDDDDVAARVYVKDINAACASQTFVLNR